MIKLLLKIPYFRGKLLKHAFKITYADRDEAAMMEHVLNDSKGQKYYRYIRPEWLPLARYEQMQIRLLEIESRISRESLKKYAEANKEAAQRNDLLTVARLAKELEERLDILYDPEVMMRFLTGMLIREDQIKTAHIWNQKLENEKFEQLMGDNEAGGLTDFFQKTRLQEHVNYSILSNTDSNKEIQYLMKEVRLFDEMTTSVLAFLRQPSSNGKQNLRTTS